MSYKILPIFQKSNLFAIKKCSYLNIIIVNQEMMKLVACSMSRVQNSAWISHNRKFHFQQIAPQWKELFNLQNISIVNLKRGQTKYYKHCFIFYSFYMRSTIFATL